MYGVSLQIPVHHKACLHGTNKLCHACQCVQALSTALAIYVAYVVDPSLKTHPVRSAGNKDLHRRRERRGGGALVVYALLSVCWQGKWLACRRMRDCMYDIT